MKDVVDCLCNGSVDSGLFVVLLDIAVYIIRVNILRQVLGSPMVLLHEEYVDDWCNSLPLRPLPDITKQRFYACPMFASFCC